LGVDSEEWAIQALKLAAGFLIAEMAAMHFQEMACGREG